MELPTYTSIWRIEKRLYKLYDFRLPMPLPVGQIAVFTAVTVPYIVLLTLFGLPFNHNLFWLYVLPPGLLTWLATRPVLESKRLPELLISQVRYLGEPSTWCRMAPLAEKEQVVVFGRVWRRAGAAEPEQVADAQPARALPVAVPVARPVPAQATAADPVLARRVRGRGRLVRARQVPEGQGPERAAGFPQPERAAQTGAPREGRWPHAPGYGYGRVAPGPASPARPAGPPVMPEAPARAARPPAAGPDRTAGPSAGPAPNARPGWTAPGTSPVGAGWARDAIADPGLAGPPSTGRHASPPRPPADAGGTAAARWERAGTESGTGAEAGTGWPMVGYGPAAASGPGTQAGDSGPGQQDRPGTAAAAGLAAGTGWPAGFAVAADQPPAGTAAPPAAPRSVPEPGAAQSAAVPPPVTPPFTPPVSTGPALEETGPPLEELPAPGPFTPGAAGPGAADQRATTAGAPGPGPAVPDAPAPPPPAAQPSAPQQPAAAPVTAQQQAARAAAPPSAPPSVPVTIVPAQRATAGPSQAPPAQPRQAPAVERALSGPGERPAGWRSHVTVVPGGRGPGRPDHVKEARARAVLPLDRPRLVVVLGCTVGAGQTVVTLMLADLLAGLRGEPVAALDLNPGPASLTELARVPAITVSALLADRAPGAHAAHRGPAPGHRGGQPARGARNRGRLDVICQDMAPDGSVALPNLQHDRLVGVLASRYPLTLADPGAPAVAKLLAEAGQLVLVAPASPDAAQAVSMTCEWLGGHGHAALAQRSIAVLNGVSQRSVRHAEQAELVLRGRCRAIVRVPWDDHLAEPEAERGIRDSLDVADGPQRLARLRPAVLQAYTALAGVLVSSLTDDPVRRRAAR